MRAGFEAAGATVGGHAIGATVSIGAATSYQAMADIDALILRADAALYRAKHAGRNRFHAADDEPGSEQAHQIAAVRRAQSAKPVGILHRKLAARRAKLADPAVAGEGTTARLL